MARSLTITPEEHARTSPLLTGFLLLSIAWLLLGTIAVGAESSPSDTPPAASGALP